MGAPNSPPPHRLPVLTEVVLMSDPFDTGAAQERVPARTLPILSTEPEPAVDPPASFAQPEVASVSPAMFIDGEPAPPEWLKRRPADERVDLPLPAMAPPSPLPPDFSGSWWASDEGSTLMPTVPVAVTMPPPSPVAPVSADQLTQRVLERLEAQMGAALDHRLQDAVLPVLARMAEGLILDVREQLTSVLRETVADAVATELARHGFSNARDSR